MRYTYEPIVSKALFAEVQNRINAVTYSNPKRHNHAFRGLVRCGQCDCMVTGETKKEIYTYYRCTHNKANKYGLVRRVADGLIPSS